MNIQYTQTKKLVADWETLIRTFIRPENEKAKATLVKYMEQILFELYDFLQQNVGITEEISLKTLADNFKNTHISKHPETKLTGVIKELIHDIAPHAVNVSSPYFIGHMTSAIPFFMVHLKTIAAALNQNVVKLETSKVLSVIERQVIAKIHRRIYNFDDDFYDEHVQSTRTTLGSFTEGGTTANITALWAARNTFLSPKPGFQGIEKQGLNEAYKAYNIDRCVVLISKRRHYSFRKAGGLLGIGNHNIISIDVDEKNRVITDKLIKKIEELKKEKRTAIIAIVGIAGTTETGNIDPLEKLGKICQKYNIHFHVDAAWGGATLMSEKYRHLLKGIELADSVTIDGHKQFYMPMTSGMVFFKDPEAMEHIAYYANYVNRRGSVDLGIKSLAGSRESNSLILYAALKIMGSGGYALLIEHGIELAKNFAQEIQKRETFQLITKPELNILTYRVCPEHIQQKLVNSSLEKKKKINKYLNKVNRIIQRLEREAGKSFVSRTMLTLKSDHDRQETEEIGVLRCVLMNPMTDMKILNEILDEQETILKRLNIDSALNAL